jgi:hypothetical protein
VTPAYHFEVLDDVSNWIPETAAGAVVELFPGTFGGDDDRHE